MTTIRLPKEHYKFLELAISADKTKPYMRHVLVMDDKRLITTDGFRMHIVPVEEQHEPGYYAYIPSSEALIMLDAEKVGRNLFLGENLLPNKTAYAAEREEPLFVVSGRGSRIVFGMDMPRVAQVKKPDQGGSDHWLTFKRAKVEGKPYAFCLGMNACPIDNEEITGEARLAECEGLLMLDALYAQDIFVGGSGLVRPVMRWVDQREGMRPTLFGDRDAPHAIVMPALFDAWSTKPGLESLLQLEYA